MLSTLKQFSQRFDPRCRFLNRVKNTENIIEIGCGRGDNLKKLRSISYSAKFHSIDLLSPADIPGDVIYRQVNLDSEPLPYPDNSVDAILLTHVIEHLRAPLSLGIEIRRVLKPDGAIYVEAPNSTSILVPSFGFKREQHNPFIFFDDPTHVHPWTKHGPFAFLQDACHLQFERVATCRNWRQLPWDFFKIIYRLLTGKRQKVISAFRNIYGWCICGIGTKKYQ